MFSRRDLMAALPALAVMGTALATAEDKPVMGSRVFNLDSFPAKKTSWGSMRSLCNAPTPTLENLEMHVSTLNPGMASHKPHRHPNEELIIIAQGTVETLSNGVWKRVGPGDVVFNASNHLHGFRNVGKEPAIYHVINWKTAATPSA